MFSSVRAVGRRGNSRLKPFRPLARHGRIKEAFGEPLGVRQLQPSRAARRRPPPLLTLQARALLRDRVPGAALEEGRSQAVLRGPGPAKASARGEAGGWIIGADVRDLYRDHARRRCDSVALLTCVSRALHGWVARELFDSCVPHLSRRAVPNIDESRHPERRPGEICI